MEEYLHETDDSFTFCKEIIKENTEFFFCSVKKKKQARETIIQTSIICIIPIKP